MGRLSRALKKVDIQAGTINEGLLELQSLILRAEEELAKDRMVGSTVFRVQARDLVNLDMIEQRIYSITKMAEGLQEQMRGLEARLKTKS